MVEQSNRRIASEFQQMRTHLLNLEERDKQKYRLRAVQTAENLALMLMGKYGVKQVYLYGSLAWGGFDHNSDIDLLLVGFSGNYWQALSDAEEIAAPIAVSLACEEDCLDALKEKVMQKGVLL
ncbi:MAG: nucleotidyltransferase domain-containing protein [Syntrophomonas sp.]